MTYIKAWVVNRQAAGFDPLFYICLTESEAESLHADEGYTLHEAELHIPEGWQLVPKHPTIEMINSTTWLEYPPFGSGLGGGSKRSAPICKVEQAYYSFLKAAPKFGETK